MSLVFRKYRCDFGHEWQAMVDKSLPPPQECPTCLAIVAASDPPHYPARKRSDKLGAPSPRGRRTKAIARFEEHALKRPHFEDGKPLFSNLRDNVRAGETHAVRETPSSNETMRMMAENIQHSKQSGGAYPIPTMGFQPVNGGYFNSTGQSAVPGLPVVDLKSNKRPA